MSTSSPSIIIGGTVAIDHVKTPEAEGKNLLGGSAAALRPAGFTFPARRARDAGQPRPGDQPIVRQLSLQLPRGSCTLLLGANGAGKTTLLRVLAGKHMVDRVPRILPVEMEDKVKDFASNVESLVDKVASGDLGVELIENMDRLVSGFIGNFERRYSRFEKSIKSLGRNMRRNSQPLLQSP